MDTSNLYRISIDKLINIAKYYNINIMDDKGNILSKKHIVESIIKKTDNNQIDDLIYDKNIRAIIYEYTPNKELRLDNIQLYNMIRKLDESFDLLSIYNKYKCKYNLSKLKTVQTLVTIPYKYVVETLVFLYKNDIEYYAPYHNINELEYKYTCKNYMINMKLMNKFNKSLSTLNNNDIDQLINGIKQYDSKFDLNEIYSDIAIIHNHPDVDNEEPYELQLWCTIQPDKFVDFVYYVNKYNLQLSFFESYGKCHGIDINCDNDITFNVIIENLIKNKSPILPYINKNEIDDAMDRIKDEEEDNNY